MNTPAYATDQEVLGLWGRSFRPFFLGLALFGALSVPWWALAWLGTLTAPAWMAPNFWHAHEMIFGFVAAAIAGFLLTASAAWSGRPALSGPPLIALFILWVVGRFAFALANFLPAPLVAAVDFAFLPAVAAAAVWTLWGSGQYRNYAVVGIIVALAITNGAIHSQVLGYTSGSPSQYLWLAIHIVVVLILVIGGRITPAFTQGALRRRGSNLQIRSVPWLDPILFGAMGGLAIAHLTGGSSQWTGIFALVAGAAAVARMAGWQSRQTLSDPLLWSLHAGSAWVVAGLLLTGATYLGAPVPLSSGLHALTTGAMGSTIIAVITRVALGHTGRPLQLPPRVVWCYLLVQFAAASRVAAPFFVGDMYRATLILGAFAWSAGFAYFAYRYWSILTEPRPDGRPG